MVAIQGHVITEAKDDQCLLYSTLGVSRAEELARGVPAPPCLLSQHPDKLAHVEPLLAARQPGVGFG